MIEVAGGIMLAGLLLGALSGSIWFMVIPAIIGFIIAASCKLVKEEAERKEASRKLGQYPSYKY